MFHSLYCEFIVLFMLADLTDLSLEIHPQLRVQGVRHLANVLSKGILWSAGWWLHNILQHADLRARYVGHCHCGSISSCLR